MLAVFTVLVICLNLYFSTSIKATPALLFQRISEGLNQGRRRRNSLGDEQKFFQIFFHLSDITDLPFALCKFHVKFGRFFGEIQGFSKRKKRVSKKGFHCNSASKKVSPSPTDVVLILLRLF